MSNALNKYGKEYMSCECGGETYGLKWKNATTLTFDVIVDGIAVGRIRLESMWMAQHYGTRKTESFSPSGKKSALEWVARTDQEWESA